MSFIRRSGARCSFGRQIKDSSFWREVEDMVADPSAVEARVGTAMARLKERRDALLMKGGGIGPRLWRG